MVVNAGFKGMKRLVALVVVLSGPASACGGWGQETGAKVERATAAPAMSEKQKKLLEDSEKLVTMAAELKVSVDKSSKNELSLDVVRRAEALEKLARSVKERIREGH